MAANTKYAVYKIFNGSDFDTVYFKAPASAITEVDTKIVDGNTIPGRHFITPEDKALVKTYLKVADFNTAGKLVQLGANGLIDSDLIDESFSNYLDKRHTQGALQMVASEVTFTNTSGVHSEFGFNINGASTNPENINKLANASTASDRKVKLSIGTDNANQEIEFTRNGELNFKKETVINNITVGDENSAVPRIYVDNALESGAKPIASVKAATKAGFDPLPSGTNLTPDQVEVFAGDRVLLKDQLDKSENGIYIVSTGEWTKVDEDDIVGALVFVEEGPAYNDSKWFHAGGGEWIKFSQTDQLKFPANGGLVKTGDDVKLQINYITDDHISPTAGIELSKLNHHIGSATNWDIPSLTPAAPITDLRSVSDRLTDLAMTINRIRGGTGNAANYGEWSENSLSMVKINNTAKDKQNPVDWGTANPSPSLFKKGDVYLLYDQET